MVRTETQSLTSTKTPEEQLVESQIRQLEDEHDLDFWDQAIERRTIYPKK